MASLAIYKNGELLQTLSLKKGEEYLVGRGSDCQAVLSGGTGISRHHFKVSYDGAQWNVELLSKFGNLSHKGGRTDHIPLINGETFSIPPFEFSFSESSSGKSSVPAVAGHPEDALSSDPFYSDERLGDTSGGLTDKTTLGMAAEKPYLKIHNNITKNDETLRLEGNVWIAGRDAECEIMLKDRGASRHHFELSQAADGFYIRDLNSANGTMVNGTQILPDQAVPIKSGDQITVLSLEISFQIRDPNYNQKLSLVPVEMMEPMAHGVPQMYGWNLPQEHVAGGGLATGEEQEEKKKFDFKKHRIKIASGVILLLAVFIGLSEPSDKSKKRGPSNVPEIFENLPKEQQDVIKNSYNVAKEQLIAKRCELALPELRRIHELVPFYQDSKTLEADCQQQIETIKIYEELQERKKQEREVQRRVEAAVARCENEMTETTTVEEVEACLGDDASLMPDHPGVQRLKAIIEEREIERQRKLQAQQDYNQRVSRGITLYNKAATLEENGEDYKAIKAYKTFLASGMPDPDGLRAKAKRSVASLEESMNGKIASMIEQANGLVEQMQFNKAMYLIVKGFKVNPTSEKLKAAQKDFESRNDREMKVIYTDSVLEENLGNIESAKDRWRKIIEISYTGSKYYKRAKSKLKKYGD